MTRNRKSARNAGTWLETATAGYLGEYVDDRIEPRRKNGARDRGDIAGLKHMGERVVVECKDKNGGEIDAATWVREAEVERGNDDATSALVVIKRRGTRAPGDQYVLMTLRDLVALITGSRPPE